MVRKKCKGAENCRDIHGGHIMKRLTVVRRFSLPGIQVRYWSEYAGRLKKRQTLVWMFVSNIKVR